jgi:hypothetical protein
MEVSDQFHYPAALPPWKAPPPDWRESWVDSRFGLIFLSNVQEEKLNIEIHRTIIFPVVLYLRETWYLGLRKWHFWTQIMRFCASETGCNRGRGITCWRALWFISLRSITRVIRSRESRWAGHNHSHNLYKYNNSPLNHKLHVINKGAMSNSPGPTTTAPQITRRHKHVYFFIV